MTDSKDIQVFEFGGKRVRTAGTHEAPLFCAADVCVVLGYADISQACEKLDQEEVEQIGAEKGPRRVLYGGPNANMYVTESGLFSLILRSEKDEAKVFKRWVTAEVLPEIRKRGYYNALEVAQRKQAEQLLAECFPHLPSKSEPIFRGLIQALLKMRREPDASGNPAWARGLARQVYDWTLHIEGQQPHRRALNPKPNGSRTDHSMFSGEVTEATKQVISAGTAFCAISYGWTDWREKMNVAFGTKVLQPHFPLFLVKGK